MRKYIFKTESKDPRPVKPTSYTWAIIGVGIDGTRRYYQMVIWLDIGVDVYDFYPEAYDVRVQQDKAIEVYRGGDQNIIQCYKTLDYIDGITYADKEVNPTLLAIIENMAYNGVSDSGMAKRMGMNFNRFKKVKSHPLIQDAIKRGIDNYLSQIADSL